MAKIIVKRSEKMNNIWRINKKWRQHLLQKRKSKEAHMQASMIFTSNDIIINSGVITAGLLVNWLNSGYPDLIIGAIVFVIVARGAYRILQLSKWRLTRQRKKPLLLTAVLRQAGETASYDSFS